MGEGVQHFLGAVGKIALRPFEISEGHRRLRGAHHNGQAQLRGLQRTRNDVPLHLHQLRLRHLGLWVRFEVAVRVLLRGNHLLQAFLVSLKNFHLVGNKDLRADDYWEAQCREALQHARECCVRKFFEAHY